MPLLQAILFGVIQALTEFLPVSSTAHLLVAGELLGHDLASEKFRAFTTIIQVGTALAVVVFFRADLVAIAGAGLRSVAHRAPFETPEARLGWLIVIGTIPAGVLGLVLEKRIERLGNWVFAASLAGLGVVLLLAELYARHERKIAELGVRDAVLIGLGQAVALVPGSSRSGSTITAGLLLGLEREAAARFSFLLSVPIIVGAGVYKTLKALPALRGDPAWRNATIVGTVVAGVAGYVVIGWFLGWMRARTTIVFVVWRLLAAVAIAVLIWRGVVPAGGAGAPAGPERPAPPVPSMEVH